MRILVIESDELLGECIRCGLSHYYHDVDWVRNGLAAQYFLQTEHFDVMVMDLDLLKPSGKEILNDIRSKNITTPAVILSSSDSACNHIIGLNINVDYLCKPFELEDLCIRIRAIKNRSLFCAKSIIAVDNINGNKPRL